MRKVKVKITRDDTMDDDAPENLGDMFEKVRKSRVTKAKKTAKAGKTAKAKVFEVKGSFTVSPEGVVIKTTKGIEKVARGRKDKSNEYKVTFIVKKK